MALSTRVTSLSAWTLSSSSSRRDLVEQTSLVSASLETLNMTNMKEVQNVHTVAVHFGKKTNKALLMSFKFFMGRFQIQSD